MQKMRCVHEMDMILTVIVSEWSIHDHTVIQEDSVEEVEIVEGEIAEVEDEVVIVAEELVDMELHAIATITPCADRSIVLLFPVREWCKL